MHVLLLGATGNLGIRLIPALLTHSHTLTAYVRSSSKLLSLLPSSLHSRINVIQGDATDSAAIKRAILTSKCDAVVNTAGVASLAPWAKSDLPVIFRAVVEAVRQASEKLKRPLRLWMLGGQGVLCVPGTTTPLRNYIPIFLAHGQNLALLKALPPNTVDWTMLCPANMTPESTDFSVPTTSPKAKLVAKATSPPLWKESWVKNIPLIGTFLTIVMNATRYETTLEQNAEFIASDLESGESGWIGRAVGVIDGGSVGRKDV